MITTQGVDRRRQRVLFVHNSDIHNNHERLFYGRAMCAQLNTIHRGRIAYDHVSSEEEAIASLARRAYAAIIIQDASTIDANGQTFSPRINGYGLAGIVHSIFPKQHIILIGTYEREARPGHVAAYIEGTQPWKLADTVKELLEPTPVSEVVPFPAKRSREISEVTPGTVWTPEIPAAMGFEQYRNHDVLRRLRKQWHQ